MRSAYDSNNNERTSRAVIAEYLGVVIAKVVYGSNALWDFFASIREVIGGRTASALHSRKILQCKEEPYPTQ